MCNSSNLYTDFIPCHSQNNIHVVSNEKSNLKYGHVDI